MKEGHVTRFTVYAIAVCLLITPVLLNNALAMHERLDCTDCHKRDKLDYMLCLKCHDRKMDRSGMNPPYSVHGKTELSGGSFDPMDYSGHLMNQCLNCHDSHHNDNFRNLKKNINDHKIAVKAIGDRTYQDNIYISGMSDFCISCHEETMGHSHPDEVYINGSPQADFDNWARLTSRLSVPEIPSGKADDIVHAKVFCLTCHLAHGGPYKHLMRWKNEEGCFECHVKN
jgi:predicted CXXCH cytochrome family protein